MKKTLRGSGWLSIPTPQYVDGQCNPSGKEANDSSKTSTKQDSKLSKNPRRIFVFGSNLHGQHWGGSAHYAMMHHGALLGVSVGLCGDSYAIPTLDGRLDKLPLHVIKQYVDQFLYFASLHPTWTFDVVAIGCGIAGFSPEEIAPMFKDRTLNVNLPKEFLDYEGQ